MREAQGDGAYQYSNDVCQKSGSRIKKDTDDNRQHRIGDDLFPNKSEGYYNVHIKYIMCHHESRYDAVEHNQGE